MPKDNEVDEKVMPVAWVSPTSLRTLDRDRQDSMFVMAERSEMDCCTEPLYSAATVAALEAEVASLRALLVSVTNPDGSPNLDAAQLGAAESYRVAAINANSRADAAERRVAELEAALRPLADATFAEFCSKKTERIEPDDSKVSYPEETCHITFGMIRNARAAITKESP